MRELQSFIICFFTVCSLPLMAADYDSEKNIFGDNITVVNGIRFNVPPDRPIQKTPYGLVLPMPLDQYVAMKISKVEKNLQDMRKSVEKIEEEITAMKEEIALLKKNPSK